MPKNAGRTTDRPQPADKRKAVPHYKPTKDLVLLLANKLTEERAELLRLQNYVTDVLGAALPDPQPIPGVESVDFAEYWEYAARVSLHDDETNDSLGQELWNASPNSADDAEMFPVGVRADEIGGAPALGLTFNQQASHVAALLKLKR